MNCFVCCNFDAKKDYCNAKDLKKPFLEFGDKDCSDFIGGGRGYLSWRKLKIAQRYLGMKKAKKTPIPSGICIIFEYGISDQEKKSISEVLT